LPLSSIPPLNAILNGTAAVFLLFGFAFVLRGKILAHKICMLSAFTCSAVFLGFYLYFHFHAGIVRFGGHGWIRPVYFTILISHTILATVSLPLILITLTFALRSRFQKHRGVAKWTYPIWLYVSITGVIVYWLLYVAYVPIGAPR
jgi:putative membrane protein